MGHIINFITETFTIENKSEIFEVNITIAENTNDLEAVMKLWKKEGVIGELHNSI